MFGNQEKVDQKAYDNLQEAFGFINLFLESSDFIAGDSVTIADWCLGTTLNSLDACGIDMSNHKRVLQYLQRLRSLPYFNEAQKGVEDFGQFFAKIKTAKQN